MSIAIVLGTRPEIIKMAPVIRECEIRNLDFFVLHTGQHYSYEMDKVFFKDLELLHPLYNLDVGSGPHAEQTGKIMIGIEKILANEQPDIVLVQGDTNTVMAGALAASKMQIKVGHIEAGLRSYDMNMPEEINRIVTDHISYHLFAPTDISKANLIKEGIQDDRIIITGNTIVDSVYQNKIIAEKNGNILDEMELDSKEYFLVTSHRTENVDNICKLQEIIKGLRLITMEYSLPIVFPIHPRTKKMISKFSLNLDGIRVIDPVGFMEFLQLESNARLVLTDSGGIQEEACILGVPCITLRDNTERPETLEVKSNVLVGAVSEKMLDGVKHMLIRGNGWMNPFGDGKASKRIINCIEGI